MCLSKMNVCKHENTFFSFAPKIVISPQIMIELYKGQTNGSIEHDGVTLSNLTFTQKLHKFFE